MTSMASTASNPSRAIPRTASIDSAISSASVQSVVSHTPTSSISSNNPLSQITGSSPADIQALIQAAGSADELIQYMLKEKQSMTAQNSQLWRLVDKQRAMILGLNKDLERALKEKDRYRKKLKEQMAMVPPLPTTPLGGAATQGPSRTLSESPAPSLDETQSRSESTSPPLGGEIMRSGSIASSIDYAPPAVEITIASYPSDYANGPAAASHQGLSRDPDSRDEGPTMAFREPIPSITHAANVDDRVESPAPLSPKTTSQTAHSSEARGSLQDLPKLHIESSPSGYSKKLGSPIGGAPTAGMGKSGFRKAPPAPLALPHSQLQNQIHADDLATAKQAVPDDKKGLSVPVNPRFLNNGPLTAPPTRPPPAQYTQNVPLTPGPSRLAHRLGPDSEMARIRTQFIRTPLPSPGLPSSPRPMDRPPNSPLPRGSKNFSLDSGLGVPGTQRPLFQSMITIPASPRSSMPQPSPRLPFPSGHERAGSEGSPISTRDPNIDLMLQPSAISSVDCRVVSSRLKPSRASMLPGKSKPSTEDSVFTLGLFSRPDAREILRVEKDVGALPALDSKLRKYITYHSRVPDRALFSGYAPARVDARRAALDEYFAGIFSATMNEPAARALCEFFSNDVVEHFPSSTLEVTQESPESTERGVGSIVTKEGYLTKRGKNFGGWKERYFVLDGPVLKYFDGPGGAHLGQIKLQNAQIGRQSASQKVKDDATIDEDSQYRHAFLVLEPKRKDLSNRVRHVLCAENDKERDEWVSALLEHVTTEKEEDSKGRLKHSKSKEGKELEDGGDEGNNGDDVSLRSMSYNEASQGPAPARGPTPDELSRQQISPSPTSMLSQSASFSSSTPVPDRSYPAKQISAPTNGSVISDLAAWGAAWGVSKAATSHEDKKAEKAAKKRSIWGFKQRISSDIDDQVKGNQTPTGYQQAVERFPLSRAVFGASLEEAVYLTKPPGVEVALPSVVYRCIEYLDAKNASEEEGIFRLSGSNVVIKGLKDKFNTESDVNLLANDEYYDVHAISGLLKLYLRELPTNILTSERRDDFVKVTEMDDKTQKIATLNNLVHNLPVENFALLKALSGHLLRIVDNSDINKMTIRNVGIVFSPTLNIPAQVFSMFLHEYRFIFFKDGEAPSSAASNPPPMTPGPMSPKIQTFEFTEPPHSNLSQPPRTPMFPSHPATIRPPGQLQTQVVSYQPNYDMHPEITSPISGSRFHPGPLHGEPSGTSPTTGGLAVPGQDAKSSKTRRRESSMMFMMGGLKKGNYQPTKSNAMVEEDLYG